MKSILLAVLFFFGGLLPAFAADDVQTMSKEELKIRLGSPDLIVLDARPRSQWESSEFKIPGARWAPNDQLDQWAAELPKDKTLLVYCACNGLGASGRAARELTAKGFAKVYALDGGWKGWQGSSYPVEKR